LTRQCHINHWNFVVLRMAIWISELDLTNVLTKVTLSHLNSAVVPFDQSLVANYIKQHGPYTFFNCFAGQLDTHWSNERFNLADDAIADDLGNFTASFQGFRWKLDFDGAVAQTGSYVITCTCTESGDPCACICS